jgi:hypothetical protein
MMSWAPPTSGADLLSAARRDSIVASELRKYLPALGLYEISPRRWVDGSRPPVRRLFELSLIRCSMMTPYWGFSLDFMPHISGGALRWHRSDKAARFDVFINPIGILTPSFLSGAQQLTDDLRKLLPEIVPAIQNTWLRGSSYVGMLEIIEDLRWHGGNYYNYESCPQLSLARAFLTAKSGDVASARRRLKEYVTRNRDVLNEDVPARLRRLIDDLGQSHAHES